MKKNNFISGAFVATLGIFVCKILGLIYVIPFYKIIGTQGGALYSYAYSIYSVFLSLSTVGIPAAVSKIVSEYTALKQNDLQKRAFEIASKTLNTVGIIAFIILFVFSDNFAYSIVGGTEGGNSVADVSIAIKVVSLALLFVPKLSILRGYFQGHKFISYLSLSNIIEQLVRVLVIIFGSYISVKIFHLPINIAVYISIFAATLGALSSYIYLKIKIKNHKSDFESCEENATEATIINNKKLFKKIVFYAIPFVLINLLQSAYSVVDTFTVVKTLTSLGYTMDVAETTISVYNTWASKLNMIVISVSMGLITSLIPEITSSYAKKNFKNINHKINQSIMVLAFASMPMSLGISFLAAPIWNVFYGYESISVSIFSVFILQVIIYSIYITLINTTQAMNQTKISLGILLLSLILKISLNIPIMNLLHSLNIGAYYGPTIANGLIEFITVIIILVILRKKYNFRYKTLLLPIIKIIACVVVMLIVLTMLKSIYFSFDGILNSIITIIIFTILGALVYFLLSIKFGLIDEVFGENFLNKIKEKLILKMKGQKR